MRKTPVVLAALAAAGLAAGIAQASDSGSGSGSVPSRLDDGKDLVSQAKISEADAIAAAKTAASGALNEVDLEHREGRLVYNVDVGSHDVKVDATTGEVLAAPQDD